MAGGAFVVFALSCGIAGGLIGRMKGSSFFMWFLICLVTLFIGLIVAILYRYETAEPETHCPRCGKTVKLYEALCTRCGNELNPGYTAETTPVAQRPA